MTTYTIGDLVKVDEKAAFRNDVQLDDFDNPQLNLGLINSYLFSSALPGGRQLSQSQYIAPAGMLEHLLQAFISDRLDNRFYLIATYGHGKSHLALALANYFSKPADSPEVSILLEKLQNALGDPAKASRYHDFKASRGEFLVLRLRGDVPRSLHEQVLRGLEKALGEHAATRDKRLPFWFKEAERIITEFTPAEKGKANHFLDKFGHDIPLLLQRLQEREDVHDLCIKLIHHVTGILPNLGGEISLAEVIRWATDEFCGEGKPLGGLLVLFDEFSLYVQRYAQRNAAGELQDLLNGISDRQGKAAFLAFSQLDLMQLADNLHLANETQVGLKRELTRIPKKWILFSLLESVVDAYLIQDDKRWEKFLQDRSIGGQVFQATDIAWERFKERYSVALRWNFEQFQERVARGCFPLHPITTYLLCNLRLQSDDAGTPRTILGFVLDELRASQTEPATQGNRPNWILPIGLIDYFEGRLSGDVYEQYENARRTIGSDAPEEQQAVLKGLLLQFLAEVNARRDEQVEFIAHTAGLPEKDAKQALRALSDNNVIRYDHTYKVYSFWAASNQPKVLEDTIQKKLAQFKWTAEELASLNKELDKLAGSTFGSIDIKVDWGHSTDWAAREYVVTADLLSAEWLRGLDTRFGYNHRNLIEADRSIALWVVANRDDEAESIREKIQQAFQTAFADCNENPPVVVAIVPPRAQPELLEAYRRRWALHNFSQQERADAGQEMYDAEIKQADRALLMALKNVRDDDRHPAELLRQSTSYMVPATYVRQLRTRSQVSLRDLILHLYRDAFAYAPPEFFIQYRVSSKGQNKLRDAVRIASEILMKNAVAELKTLVRRNSVLRDLCDKFLVQKWDLLRPDYRIKEEPGSQRVRAAWQHIDNAIQSENGENKLRDALFPLLNPPYGYDYNTALLLFAAWFGYHRFGLEVHISNRRVEHQKLIDWTQKNPKDFFQAIAISDIVSLKRRVMPDASKVKSRLREIATEQFTQEEANNEIIALREIMPDQRYSIDLRNSVEQAAENLAQAHKLAVQYDQEAAQLREQISQANSARELIALQKKIAKLPELSNVKAREEEPAALRERIARRFTAVIEAVCTGNESPSDLTEVGLRRECLLSEKKAVTSARFPALVQRIDESLARLEQRETELRQELQREQDRQNISATINSVDPHGRLEQLISGAATLRSLTNLPDDLVQKRDTRLQQVQKAIAGIREQISQARRDLQSSADRSKVSQTRDMLLQLQIRCVGREEEEAEIADLIAQADQRLAELAEEERNINEWRMTIRAVNAKEQRLRALLDGRATLQALSSLPEVLIPERDDRLQEVETAINALEQQVEQAGQVLDTVSSLDQLDNHRAKLRQLKQDCEDTPAEAALVQHIERADNLRGFFEKLESERRPQIESPRSAMAQKKRLQQLMGDYQLSAVQKLVVEERMRRVDAAVKAQQERAESWIRSKEKAHQDGADPLQLKKELATPPPEVDFLPSARRRAITLSQQIQDQIDADTLTAIESRFRSISDRRIQEKCLQNLKRIYLEMHTTQVERF